MSWEVSVLRECTARHLGVLQHTGSQHFQIDACLLNQSPPRKAVLQVLAREFGECRFAAAKTARLNEWETASQGDVVLVFRAGGLVVGEVIFHASVDDGACPDGPVIISMLQTWSFVRRGARFAELRMGGEALLCDTGELQCTLTFAKSANGLCHVLLPRKFRDLRFSAHA